MERFERRLDQFRQVLCEEREGLDGSASRGPIRFRYYRIQQLWKVQIGPTYVPVLYGPPDRKEDEFVHATPEGPIWIPCKHEWRYLPEVTEEEAKKDSA